MKIAIIIGMFLGASIGGFKVIDSKIPEQASLYERLKAEGCLPLPNTSDICEQILAEYK